MLVLINKERVVQELVGLARLRIAERLSISGEDVEAVVNLDDGNKLQTHFQVDQEKVPSLSEKEIKEAIAPIHSQMVIMMAERFRGVERRWIDGREEEKPGCD